MDRESQIRISTIRWMNEEQDSTEGEYEEPQVNEDSVSLDEGKSWMDWIRRTTAYIEEQLCKV